eukprot:GHVU01131847.1.p4 GENE.GHVU01131847.1~~GHVU01131847.1.p4  ORF type:complete len:122 (+),score=30.33 GHVU01131847.1:1033-1398(+)
MKEEVSTAITHAHRHLCGVPVEGQIVEEALSLDKAPPPRICTYMQPASQQAGRQAGGGGAVPPTRQQQEGQRQQRVCMKTQRRDPLMEGGRVEGACTMDGNPPWGGMEGGGSEARPHAGVV